MLNVVCINAGNYQGRGVEYVNNLYRMVKENLTVPFNFVCFTDDYHPDKMAKESGYSEGVYIDALPNPEFTGWWHKISLFKPGLFPAGDRVLYIDLSTVIMGNIDDFADYDGLFCMGQSFGGGGVFGWLQSNVMAWSADDNTAIYKHYLKAGCPAGYPGGDQKFIEDHNNTLVETWADVCPGKFVSYKWGLEGRRPDRATMLCFHGHPKPHEVTGWAYEAWSGKKEQEVTLMRPADFIDVCNTDGEQVCSNIRENAKWKLPRIRLNKHEAVIVGGGPSAAGFLTEIDAKQKAGAQVFALNGSAEWLLNQGIEADYHVILDARPENAGFLDYHRGNLRTMVLLAAQCDPALFKRALINRIPMQLWHIDPSDEVVELIKEVDPGSHLVAAGPTVGLTVLNLAWTMGYRKADLYGYDSSSTGQDMHHAYPQPMNDGALTDDYTFEGKTYRAQRALASQAQHFIAFYQMLEQVGLQIEVHGDGLLPDMWRAEERERAASKGSLEASEAYKYRRCWQTKEYREYSPGELLADKALELLAPGPGSSFIDFGCGTGRPGQKIADAGHKVLLIDHAANCRDSDILLPFCLANLWALPEGIEAAGYGYCTDVMEHIHNHKIDAVLEAIKRHVKKAVFFNIASHDARWGRTIGVGELHITQQPPEWWMGRLLNHFNRVEHKGDGVFVCYISEIDDQERAA